VRGLAPAPRAGGEAKWSADGWQARLTRTLDSETDAFETELRARVELPLFQRHAWLKCSSIEHHLMQLRDPSGAPAMQAALRVERPRRMPTFGRAYATKLGAGISAEAEWFGVRALRALACEAGDLVSLRLQPYRREIADLRDFEGRARRAGYALAEPVGVTRTLVVDLAASADERIAAMSKKTRAKIRHKSRANIEVRDLDGSRWIPSCIAATNESMARTRGGTTHYDFAAVFALREADPSCIKALGVFLPERPDELLAFVIAVRHGAMAEYAVAGSVGHPMLRSMPFNYFLLWELIAWARDGGAQWLDLGGLTDGGPGDPRAGISDFKRHFSERDVELGREFNVNLQPARALALDVWSDLYKRRSADVEKSPPDDGGST